MFKLPKQAKLLMAKMKKAGFECFAVGGCVRDMIRGRETKDWDFATNALPDQIQKLFPDSFYDNKFGTVGIPIKSESRIKNQESSNKNRGIAIYEVTTYRSEQGYSDHRHPDRDRKS